jgi:hypothetical protein
LAGTGDLRNGDWRCIRDADFVAMRNDENLIDVTLSRPTAEVDGHESYNRTNLHLAVVIFSPT